VEKNKLLETIGQNLKNLQIARFDGVISIFQIKNQQFALFTHENPLLNAVLVKKFEPNHHHFIIEGRKYFVKDVIEKHQGGFLEKLEILLESTNGDPITMSWDGKSVIVRTILKPTINGLQHEIELIKSISRPFILAEALFLSGRETIFGNYIPLEIGRFSPDNLDEMGAFLQDWGRDKVIERILSPFYVATHDAETLRIALAESVNPDILMKRLANHILTVIKISKKVLMEDLCLQHLPVGSKNLQEEIIKIIASLFWLKKPLVRADPICPEKKEFIELVWLIHQLIVEHNLREDIDSVAKKLSEHIDPAKLILSIKEKK